MVIKKRNPVFRDVFRSVKTSKTRFFAVFGIIALACGFFCGLFATSYDMRETADNYYDDTDMYDIRVLSTTGFSDADISALRETGRFSGIYGGFFTDKEVTIGENSFNYRFHSLCFDRNEDNEDYICRPILVEGRYPENAGECVIGEYKTLSNISISIGDSVIVKNTEGLKNESYKIVGIVRNSVYISYTVGTTDIGNGVLNGYLFTSEDEFTASAYSELTATVKGAKELFCFGDEYRDSIDEAVLAGEAAAEKRETLRDEEIKEAANAQTEQIKNALTSAQNEYNAALNTYTALVRQFGQETVQAQAYASSLPEAEKTVEELKQKLAAAEESFAAVRETKWYVLDRESNVGYNEISSDCDRMQALSKTFPVIFYLVAALVCLTTMTRMIDEERGTIGTYKALGFSNGAIIFKYILYGGIPTVAGGIIGPLIGFAVLPRVIWSAYRILYTAPDIVTPYRPVSVLISVAAALAIVTAATYFSCRASLKSNAAVLLQPLAPKPGRRVILERIPFIWKRFSFSVKVTARNLLRYKKRLFMAIIGIAGCTALLLVGFGIRDSVSDVLHLQYGELSFFDTTVTLENCTEKTEKTASHAFEKYIFAAQKTVEVNSDDKSYSVNLMSYEDEEHIDDFVLFRTRTGHKPVPFGADSVIINEKLAKLLGVGVGDEITVKSGDTEVFLTVDGIIEHYINHFIYMGHEKFADIFGECGYTDIFGISKTADSRDEMKSVEGVKTVTATDESMHTFDNMISSINLVIVVLIVCAGMLALIVLYNLTNINVSERMREIATLKVLGFNDREVNAYIYRETAVLSVLGCAVGLVLGLFLHQYVIQSVEIDMAMFGRSVSGLSYLFSALITLVFSAAVNLIINRRLKKIDMAESLKSGE